MYGMAVLFWEFSMAVNNLNSNFNYCKTWQNSISNKLVQRYAIAATNGFRNYRRFSLKLFFKPCSKKSIFYFLNNCRKLTDFNYFGMKIWHENHLTDCPSHLSDVATVPWEIQTSFSTVLFIHTSDYVYVIPQEKNCNPLFHPTWKCHHTNLWIAKLFSSDWRFVAFFQTLETLKRAGCGLWSVALKRTGCDVWQLECQASIIIVGEGGGKGGEAFQFTFLAAPLCVTDPVSPTLTGLCCLWVVARQFSWAKLTLS